MRTETIKTLVAATTLLSALTTGVTASAQSDVLAITNVSVIPIDAPGLVEAQTVLVEGGLITEMGDAASVVVPQGATTVDGTGKYLMPGLSDMHTHTEGRRDALVVTLANGITRIQALNAVPSDMETAALLDSGDLLGPDMLTAPHAIGLPPEMGFARDRLNFAFAPAFDVTDFIASLHEWPIIEDEASARAFMDAAIAAGADSIKTNLFCPRHAFDLFIEESGLPVQGHISGDIGVEPFLESGGHVHHVSELSHYVSSNGIQGQPLTLWNYDQIDEKLPALIDMMVEAGTYFTPTVDLGWFLRATLEDAEAVVSTPEMAYIPAERRAAWQLVENNPALMMFDSDEGRRVAEAHDAYAAQLVTASSAAGVNIMTGTDCTAVPGMVCGFSLHTELAFLVELGLSEQEALTASTLTPARFAGEEDVSGSVTIGKRADLVLLNGNPLEAIESSKDIAGVVRAGRWLSRQELDGMLAALAEEFAD